MSFIPKVWKNLKAGGTKLDAAALIDLEERVSDYTDIETAAEKARAEAAEALNELLANKDTDPTLAANSDTKYVSQKAVKAYVDGLLAASDAVIYKGVIDCSTNPKFPAANAGHLYRVSKSGKIGGALGTHVEVGDTLLCNTDGSAEGTWSEVNTKWNIIQANIDGAVIGPGTVIEDNIAIFGPGPSGTTISDSGFGKSFLEALNAGISELEERIEGAELELPEKQPLDADLTAIAALAPADGATLIRSGSSWAALGIGSTSQQMIVRSDGTIAYQTLRFHAGAWGAKFDGSTDDSTAIQNAINAAAESSGEALLPAGTGVIGTTLTMKAKVHLRGAGVGATVLKLKKEAKTDVIKTANYGAAGISDFSIRELTINGNKAENTKGSGLLIDGQHFQLDSLQINNCAEDGLNAQCTTDGEDKTGGTESFATNIKVWTCGGRNVRWDIHDGHLVNVVCIARDETSALTNFLIDSNAGAVKLMGCHAWGQCKYAMEVKASIHAVGCEAEGGVTANVNVNTDNMTWLGGKVFKDGSGHGEVGFLFQSGKGNNTLICGTKMAGCEGGDFKFTGEAPGSLIADIISEQPSGKKSVTGSPASSVLFSNIKVEGGGTVGIAQTVKRSAPSAGNNLIEGRVDGDEQARVSITHSGEVEFGPGNASRDTFLRRAEKEVLQIEGALDRTKRQQELASAATITPAAWADVLVITGTTEVKKITATRAGHVLALRWASTAKLVAGENLKIPATLSPTEHDSCILHCDGTNWYQSSPLQANP